MQSYSAMSQIYFLQTLYAQRQALWEKNYDDQVERILKIYNEKLSEFVMKINTLEKVKAQLSSTKIENTTEIKDLRRQKSTLVKQQETYELILSKPIISKFQSIRPLIDSAQSFDLSDLSQKMNATFNELITCCKNNVLQLFQNYLLSVISLICSNEQKQKGKIDDLRRTRDNHIKQIKQPRIQRNNFYGNVGQSGGNAASLLKPEQLERYVQFYDENIAECQNIIDKLKRLRKAVDKIRQNNN